MSLFKLKLWIKLEVVVEIIFSFVGQQRNDYVVVVTKQILWNYADKPFHTAEASGPF